MNKNPQSLKGSFLVSLHLRFHVCELRMKATVNFCLWFPFVAFSRGLLKKNKVILFQENNSQILQNQFDFY